MVIMKDFWKLFLERLRFKGELKYFLSSSARWSRRAPIQILEDMLRACVIDFRGKWDDHLPLLEFADNNSYTSYIRMAHCYAHYGRICRSLIGWFKIGKTGLIGQSLVHQSMEKVKVIQERFKTT